MRILVVGAGAVGGYFGGRLAAAGRDVTFLVRRARAEKLAKAGLRISSPRGDAFVPAPKLVTAEDLRSSFDLVVLSCKAHDLDAAIAAFGAAVGPSTAILPLLNGMRHLDRLERAFGVSAVLGGQCVLSTTLDDDGTVRHLNDLHELTYGARVGGVGERTRAIANALTGANFGVHLSEQIILEMWEKWVVLASMAASTSLMRAPIGHIVSSPGGRDFMLALIAECEAVASANRHTPRAAFMRLTRANLTEATSPLTSSMSRDIARGAPIEADHIVGDLISRGDAAGVATPLLRLAFTHLKAYERQRGHH